MANFFKKITDSVKKIGKNPLDVRAYGDLGLATVTAGQVDTHGVNGMDSFEDVMYGKKTKTDSDAVADMVKAGQMKGISELNKTLDTDATAIVNTQAEQAKEGIVATAADARRNAQRTIAQRGLAGSSLGLAQNRTIDENAGNEIANVNANLPGQIRDQALKDASVRISQGGLGAANPIQWNAETDRGGGLLDTAAKIAPLVGSYYGLANTNAQTNYLKSLTPQR